MQDEFCNRHTKNCLIYFSLGTDEEATGGHRHLRLSRDYSDPLSTIKRNNNTEGDVCVHNVTVINNPLRSALSKDVLTRI